MHRENGSYHSEDPHLILICPPIVYVLEVILGLLRRLGDKPLLPVSLHKELRLLLGGRQTARKQDSRRAGKQRQPLAQRLSRTRDRALFYLRVPWSLFSLRGPRVTLPGTGTPFGLELHMGS